MATTQKQTLAIQKLHVQIDEKEILHGVDLVIKPGKVAALMGPNGSGKSTLAQVLMGNPEYEVTKGRAAWQGKNLLKLEVHERAQLGLFLSFQYPRELPGVNMYEFLATSFKALHGEKQFNDEFEDSLQEALKTFKLSEKFLDRNVNEGFSGGEKKKSEMLQLMVLRPRLAILDETDSGLDIDALKLVAQNVTALKNPQTSFLVITHYQRLLNFLKPDEVHVMLDGKIVKSGKANLVKQLESKGYSWLKN